VQGQVKAGAAGALAGLFVWIYDYQFFLNAGGAATPISTAILRLSRLEQANVLVFMLWPLVVLMAIGTGLGFLLSSIVAGHRSR
jgi:hypothetical protein